MPDETNYISQKKYDELKEELTYLTHTKRSEIAEKLTVAKSFGDLSENAEFHEAREQQAELEGKIQRIEQLLKTAVIKDSHSVDCVEAGSTVELRPKGARTTIAYTLVGPEEADIAQNRISYKSPIGQQLLGKVADEQVTISTPAGKKIFTVISIS